MNIDISSTTNINSNNNNFNMMLMMDEEFEDSFSHDMMVTGGDLSASNKK